MKSRLLYLFFIILIGFFILSSAFLISDNAVSKEVKLENNKCSLFKNNFVFGFNIKLFDGRFLVYKQPSSSPPANGFPVVFLFHGAVQHSFAWFFGLNLWNRAQVSFTKNLLGNGFFVVGFESLKPVRQGPRAWNSFEKNVSLNYDILHVKKVISWLENSSLPVDVENIYCAGFSSGAFFCSRLAQSYNYDFKGVILNSGCNANSINISDKGPVFNCSTGYEISSFHPPTLIIHGKKDKLVPYDCGESYYLDLNESCVDVTMFSSSKDGHIWLKDFNSMIVEWIKNCYFLH